MLVNLRPLFWATQLQQRISFLLFSCHSSIASYDSCEVIDLLTIFPRHPRFSSPLLFLPLASHRPPFSSHDARCHHHIPTAIHHLQVSLRINSRQYLLLRKSNCLTNSYSDDVWFPSFVPMTKSKLTLTQQHLMAHIPCNVTYKSATNSYDIWLTRGVTNIHSFASTTTFKDFQHPYQHIQNIENVYINNTIYSLGLIVHYYTVTTSHFPFQYLFLHWISFALHDDVSVKSFIRITLH